MHISAPNLIFVLKRTCRPECTQMHPVFLLVFIGRRWFPWEVMRIISHLTLNISSHPPTSSHSSIRHQHQIILPRNATPLTAPDQIYISCPVLLVSIFCGRAKTKKLQANLVPQFKAPSTWHSASWQFAKDALVHLLDRHWLVDMKLDYSILRLIKPTGPFSTGRQLQLLRVP